MIIWLRCFANDGRIPAHRAGPVRQGSAGGNGMAARVLVTPRGFLDLEGEHLGILKQAGYEVIANPRPRTLTEDEMAAYIVGMDAVIVGDDPVTHRVLDRATGLKVISKFGTHVDNIDVDVAAARHIPVAFTPGVTHAAVAELTIGLMIALLRGIPQLDRDIRNGKWSSVAGVALIEEGSVLDALRGQRLRGAAFDLPSEENLFTVPFLTQDNVLVSCHSGSNTEESVRRQAVMAAENVVAVLSGQPKLAALATSS